MPAAGSKDSKDTKRPKLSLRKRTQKEGQGASGVSKGTVQGVLPGPADLNETCEFREPALFGQLGNQCKQQKGTVGNTRHGLASRQTSSAVAGRPEVVKDGVARRPDAVKDGVARRREAVKDGVARRPEAVKDGVARRREAVKDGVARRPEAVKDGVARRPEAVKDGVARRPEAVKDGVARRPEAVKDGVARRPEAVKDGVARRPEAVKDGVAMATEEEKKEEGEEEMRCQVCSKSLSNMSSQRRQQHVNRCIDRTVEKDQADRDHQELLERARTAVLDCPMCGKALKTDTSRLSHLKKCSQELGVATETLLKLTRDQEAERRAQLDKGVLPGSVRNLKVKSAAQSKKRKTKEPRSQYEEDVQVAMAISSSLAEQEKHVDEDFLGKNVASGDGAGGQGKGQGSKKSKKKAGYEDLCLLTTLSEADKQRRLEEKVNNILLHEEPDSSSFQDSVKLLQSELKLAWAREGRRALWDQSIQTPEDRSREMFYVRSLMPPLVVSTCVAGRKANKVTRIPGREVTFIEEKTDTEKKEKKYSEGDDIITASTQTAVVLAELAMDDTSLPCSLENPGDTSLLSNTQYSGYCVQTLVLKEEDQRQEKTNVLLDFRSLVNNADCSDMTVTTQDGQTLYAHTAILSVRCPKLIKMAEKSVVRIGATFDLAMTLLTYIYTGELTLTASKTELEMLANQLELPALAKLCESLVISKESSDDTLETDEVDCGAKEVAESKLDLKQIWGESDSETDEEEGRVKQRESDMGDDVNTEVEDEDYHAIMCTQRRRLSASKLDDANESDSIQDGSKSDDFDCSKADDIDSSKADDIDRSKADEVISSKADDVDPIIHDTNTDDIEVFEDSDRDANAEEAVHKVPVNLRKRNKEDTSDRTNVCKERVVNLDEDVDSADVGHNVESKDVGGDIDMQEDQADILNSSVVVSSDDEVAPSPKRARLSTIQEMEVDSAGESTCVKNNATAAENMTSVPGSSLQDIEHKDVTRESRSSIGSNSACSLNQSGADLFGSPTPVKSTETVLFTDVELPKTVEREADSPDLQETIERASLEASSLVNKGVKRKLAGLSPIPGNSMDNSIVLTDSDSNISEDDERNTGNISTPVLSDRNVGRHIIEDVQEMDELETGGNVVCDKSVDLSDSLKSGSDEAEKSASMYDDDELEITGDNFEELAKGSPVFKDKKFSKSKVKLMPSDHHRDIEKLGVDEIGMKDDVDQCFEDSFNDEMVKDGTFIDKSVHHDEPDDSDEMEENKYIDKSSCSEGNVITIESEESLPGIDEDERVDILKDKEGDPAGCSDSRVSSDSSPAKRNDKLQQSCDENAECLVVDDKGREEIENDEDHVGHVTGSSGADVWEDFDDDGVGFLPPVESPGAGTVQAGQDGGGMEDTSFEDGEDSFVFHVDSEKPHAKTKAISAAGSAKETFVTPKVVETKKAKKSNSWVPPSPFTPMPQYDKMATPEIKKAVKRYGVKPVGKKRMVKVLKDIYQQTHAYETDSDCEEVEVTASLRAAAAAGGTNKADDEEEDSDDEGEPVLSQESQGSDDSEAGDVFEESCLHMVSSDSDASSPQKSVDINRQIFDYFRKNPALHKRVLMYEPLELDVLKSDLKEAKVKCSMDKLMDFLDERCIAFTTKNCRNSRRGRNKKASPKKAGAKSPRKPGRPKSSKSITTSQS